MRNWKQGPQEHVSSPAKTLLEDIDAWEASPRLSQKEKAQPGRWLVRRYIGGERYRIAALGIADDFEDAAVSYEERSALPMSTASISRTTSRALSSRSLMPSPRYVEWMKLNRATGPEVEQRAALHILPYFGSIQNFRVDDASTQQMA